MKQLEQQKTHREVRVVPIKEKEVIPGLPENLTLDEDVEVTFQTQIAPDFTQAFDDQFHALTNDKEKSFMTDGAVTTQTIDNRRIIKFRNAKIEFSKLTHSISIEVN